MPDVYWGRFIQDGNRAPVLKATHSYSMSAAEYTELIRFFTHWSSLLFPPLASPGHHSEGRRGRQAGSESTLLIAPFVSYLPVQFALSSDARLMPADTVNTVLVCFDKQNSTASWRIKYKPDGRDLLQAPSAAGSHASSARNRP